MSKFKNILMAGFCGLVGHISANILWEDDFIEAITLLLFSFLICVVFYE